MSNHTAELARLGSATVYEGGGRNGQITGKLVETHRETAILRAGEIDLHDHRRRPSETLAHAE